MVYINITSFCECGPNPAKDQSAQPSAVSQPTKAYRVDIAEQLLNVDFIWKPGMFAEATGGFLPHLVITHTQKHRREIPSLTLLSLSPCCNVQQSMLREMRQDVNKSSGANVEDNSSYCLHSDNSIRTTVLQKTPGIKYTK